MVKLPDYRKSWDELVEIAKEQDANGIKAKLKEIISEYTPFELQIAD